MESAFVAVFRIGLVLFFIELLIMLGFSWLLEEGSMETWFTTLEDALLLAVASTPLIIRWSLKEYYKTEMSLLKIFS
ncbi:MAG: hypothetical protein HQL94_05850, partial [Magnetococcales bacterium]|nr:hypothetical protein [Magnetococcales bacterium]